MDTKNTQPVLMAIRFWVFFVKFYTVSDLSVLWILHYSIIYVYECEFN